MDDIKLFAKKERELETLIQTVRIYSPRIRMEFGIKKFTTLVRKYGKLDMTEGIELPNQEKIRTLWEKKTYKYLGILEAVIIKQVEMKESILKEYLKRTRKIFETNYVAGTLSRDRYLGYPSRKILGTILEADQRRT